MPPRSGASLSDGWSDPTSRPGPYSPRARSASPWFLVPLEATVLCGPGVAPQFPLDATGGLARLNQQCTDSFNRGIGAEQNQGDQCPLLRTGSFDNSHLPSLRSSSYWQNENSMMANNKS